MKLYHGTSERHIKSIIAEGGIRPRSVHGRTNWKHSIESNPKAVYLTDTYAGYFAFNASADNERWAILEIDTDKLDSSKLHPDEDAMEQISRGRDLLPKKWSMIKRTRHYRHQAPNNPNWMVSLQALGTCAYYGTIPLEAITKVVYFNPEIANPQIAVSFMDAQISVLAFKMCGHMHRAKLRWLMGELVTPVEWSGFDNEFAAGQWAAINKALKESERAITREGLLSTIQQ